MKDLDLFLQRYCWNNKHSKLSMMCQQSANRSTAAYTAPTQDATVRDAPEGLVGVSEDQVADARAASYSVSFEACLCTKRLATNAMWMESEV
jgi:hypothetical protein